MKKLGIILWTIVAMFGVMLAVCVSDGSKCEIGLRLTGLVCFGIGAVMAGYIERKDARQ